MTTMLRFERAHTGNHISWQVEISLFDRSFQPFFYLFFHSILHVNNGQFDYFKFDVEKHINSLESYSF